MQCLSSILSLTVTITYRLQSSCCLWMGINIYDQFYFLLYHEYNRLVGRVHLPHGSSGLWVLILVILLAGWHAIRTRFLWFLCKYRKRIIWFLYFHRNHTRDSIMIHECLGWPCSHHHTPEAYWLDWTHACQTWSGRIWKKWRFTMPTRELPQIANMLCCFATFYIANLIEHVHVRHEAIGVTMCSALSPHHEA